ncbi:MAG TPA: histone deacetylase [Thermoanaerobaculia bacterium]|nr:histone deacetylase [Thermoanaerobaculia bacterium]
MRVFTDPRCLEHHPPPGLPECSERLSAILEHLRAGGWHLEEPPSAGASERGGAPSESARRAVAAVHPDEYVERFRRSSERGDSLFDSADNPMSPGTWPAAWGAVEATLAAADAAAAGAAAFAAIRPPGHHAERDTAMGFCWFNNVAVAAEHLRRHHGVERVAIFDFDVHHGNGTQHLFEARADVFYASTHQFPFYPGTGAAGERGVGAGEGATLNVPLPAGTGDAGYREAVAERVIPALDAFAPDVLLVSAGFDAWRGDPLGGMRVSEEGFAVWSRLLADLAHRRCGGRVLSLLEGGYDLTALPRLVAGHLAALAGRFDSAAGSEAD